MKRINTANRASDLFGAGKDGFKAAQAGVSSATFLSALFMNHLQEAIVRTIESTGATLSDTDYDQFPNAIKALIEARVGDYVPDTGIANAYVVAMNPAITVYSAQTQGQFKSSHANTGASTLNAGGGVRPLVRSDGTPTRAGDIPLNGIVSFTYDTTTSSFVIAGMVPSQATGRLLRTAVFTASGTWTAGDGTNSIEVEVVGGGGGGGGAQATAASEFSTSAGGGGGGYARKFMLAPGTPQTVTIGSGGASTAAAAGSAGGTTSFGSLLSATGGGGGAAGLASVANRVATGGLGGMGVGGDINAPGNSAALAIQWASSGAALLNPSLGGSSMFGAASFNGAPAPGASRGYGAGGTGATNTSSTAATAGVAGTSGIVIVKEFA